MKFLRYFLMAVFFATMVGFTSVRAEGIDNAPNTLNSLNNQLFAEVKSALSTPVYLTFSDKNISGIATITYTVLENGKITVLRVVGENSTLNEYLAKKLNEQNLWTDQKFSGTFFTYSVVSK